MFIAIIATPKPYSSLGFPRDDIRKWFIFRSEPEEKLIREFRHYIIQ